MGGGGGGGRFTGTIGAGGALSDGTLYAAANMGIVTDAGGARRESIQALPKAPPPISDNQPLTRFEELVLEEKLSDRKTLPQYRKVFSEGSLNAGHNKGFETRELRAGDDIIVYVKNRNLFSVPLKVKAGPSSAESEKQERILRRGDDAVFRFKTHGQLIQYLSIGSQADSFMVEFHVFSRGHYARR